MPALLPSAVLQNKFSAFFESGAITIPYAPVIGPDDRVFTIGSCFAQEIKIALAAAGLRVGPNYDELAVALGKEGPDELPARNHLNHYNAFTVRDEFRRVEGTWVHDGEDVWTLGGRGGRTPRYQDPYRRLVIADSHAALHAMTADLDRLIAAAVRTADVFLITYGMTEVYRNKRNGNVVCQKPNYGGGGGAAETAFWQSSYEDNLAAVRETVAIIARLRPESRIFVTVSPVPLGRTFAGRDVYVANMEGKSTLRAVLGQVEREFAAVTYFPAYEAVMSFGARAFDAFDGRHVRRAVVQSIMTAFVQAHVRNPERYLAAPQPSRAAFARQEALERLQAFAQRARRRLKRALRRPGASAGAPPRNAAAD